MNGFTKLGNTRLKLLNDVTLTEQCITEKWLPICLADKTGNCSGDCALCCAYKNEGSCYSCPIVEGVGARCYQNVSAFGGRLWYYNAESWYQLDASLITKYKQRAYTMLFYLHDLADSLREKLEELESQRGEGER